MYNKHITYILYDGIQNSVFESQVLQPLLTLIQQSSNIEVTLVSFEKKRPPIDYLTSHIPANDNLHLVLCRKIPFFGKLSLTFAIYQFKKLLSQIHSHHIIARGPLAGYITIQTVNKLAQKFPEKLRSDSEEPLPEVTIQARGLCAEEYRYSSSFSKSNFLKSLWNKFIYKQLDTIEFEVYRNKRKTDYPQKVIIESVSQALKDYLITHFRADKAHIIIATKDIPKTIPQEQIAQWRQEIRQELNIPHDAIVYCYSGSYKPWQCTEQTVEYFSFEFSKNPKSFLLVLSQDQKPFITQLQKYKIPETNYKVLSVRAAQLYKYLAGADFGMLYREKDIINWVSRPTKMLEYQSVGLKIIHNNTIAWLAKK